MALFLLYTQGTAYARKGGLPTSRINVLLHPILTAIAPRSGASYFLGLPKLTAALFQRFLDEFAQAHPHTLNVLLLDNSRCHTAQVLQLPPNVILLFQPPYAPEVNPAERVWQALKDKLAWHAFADLAALQARVIAIVEPWEAALLRSLTAYPFIMEAINALSS